MALYQNLGETYIENIGQLRHGCKSEPTFVKARLRMYRKTLSLNCSHRNIVLSLNTKREFCAIKLSKLKSLDKSKIKLINFTEVIADANFFTKYIKIFQV